MNPLLARCQEIAAQESVLREGARLRPAMRDYVEARRTHHHLMKP